VCSSDLLLKTFRVVAIPQAGTVTVYPAIVDGSHGGATDTEKDYANVDSTPANGAVVTFINTTTAGTNPFWCNDSIEIFSGNLNFPDEGVEVMRQSTDSGIEIIFAKQGDILTGVTTYRLTMFFGVTNLNPEMNGILLGSQA